MFGLGFQELIIIFIIILLLFGAKKLPELARGLGKGINEFKRAQQGLEEEIKNVTSEKPVEKEIAEKISKLSDEDKAKLVELLNKK
ncbi:MAG: Sec-independent protein translocase subunit TatA/TatB [Chlorobiales bacterium]